MALGARPGQILGVMLRIGMLPVLIGMIVGLGASAGLHTVIASLLFRVRALDPLMYGITLLVLLVVAGLAVCFPRVAQQD
jgi:putative ABC transport system permease protein